MARLEISHNDIGEIQRGNWRKFNPYNPYVEEDEKNKANDLKVESLDDLFEDDSEDKKEKVSVNSKNSEDSKISGNGLLGEEDAPVLPMDSETEEDYDLQKELEAKFDELFGPIDDN